MEVPVRLVRRGIWHWLSARCWVLKDLALTGPGLSTVLGATRRAYLRVGCGSNLAAWPNPVPETCARQRHDAGSRRCSRVPTDRPPAARQLVSGAPWAL